MIKNLVFDFGKVLVNHDLQPVLDRYFGDSTDDKSRFAEILSAAVLSTTATVALYPSTR